MLLSLQMALAALRFTDTTDGELVELYLLTRGERYFGELYKRYGPRVYTRCRSLLGDEHEAHDAVQEIFERVLTRIGSFRKESAFGTWVYAIASNHCLDRLRKRARLREQPTEEQEIGALIEQRNDGAEHDWLVDQAPGAIKFILGRLNESDRSALVLMYMEDLSVQEIAATLGLKESAAKMRLSRARTRARTILDEYNHPETTLR